MDATPDVLFFLRIWTAAHRAERLVARELEADGVAGPQLAMLLLVGLHEPATTTALAAALGVPFMTASDALGRLVANGDVVAAANPADRRSQVYSLTDAGRARVRAVEAPLRRAASVVKGSAEGLSAVYVWAGGGSVWLGLESDTQVARVDPATARVRLVDAGDGASGFATDGSSVWVVSHRDNALTRVDLATGRSTLVVANLSPAATTAAERVAYAGGALWITGRGLDLLRVDPATGAIVRTIEIGPAGIEVLAVGPRLVVSAATARGARRSDPILGAVVTVDASSGRVAKLTSRPAFTNGLAVLNGTAWSVDTVGGAVARFALGR